MNKVEIFYQSGWILLFVFTLIVIAAKIRLSIDKAQLSDVYIPVDYDVNGIWFEEDRPMTDKEFAEEADMIFSFQPKNYERYQEVF